MKIISEKTKQEYKTVEECQEAEKKFDAENEAKTKQKEERARRAKEVDDAFKKADEELIKAKNLLNAFVNDFESYHTTIKKVDGTFDVNLDDLITRIFLSNFFDII